MKKLVLVDEDIFVKDIKGISSHLKICNDILKQLKSGVSQSEFGKMLHKFEYIICALDATSEKNFNDLRVKINFLNNKYKEDLEQENIIKKEEDTI
ncbi:hypothetical protein N452_14600 [Clostridium botulinum A2 117]|uniref:hypothetical protein n=1 Tax=Clostridium botulinum TaxID=1491 RepID=UPI0007DF67FE|nr:hypothetical protein [Clostridium botulinum]KEI79750.1 hypothetical protein N452_14600 [Clostridium botulinum A2 117]MBN3416834.1 hypothetical protein [Clostridium botulinum]MBN3443325.1 hypothetical protein [Clostridium botulinum]MBY6806948.1 hypothetical protein [Clostridium botulinum]